MHSAYSHRGFDSKKDGPGIWFTLHVLGIHVDSPSSEENYIRCVGNIIEGIRCQECHDDGIIYLRENPIRGYRKAGIFYWSVDFHNWVNWKLGKPVMSREDAYKLYSPNQEQPICTKGCGEKKHKQSHFVPFR